MGFLQSRRREHAAAASSTIPLAALPPLGAALGTAAPLPVPVPLPRSRSATPGPIDAYSPPFVRQSSPRRSGSAQRSHGAQHSPVRTGSRSPLGMLASRPVAAASGSWGMPALTAPVAIGGAERFMLT